jgi:hypothetical protein
MALLYRKLVRDAVVAALSASFNGNHAAAAALYGVTPIALDFSSASQNFVQVYIDPAELELSPILTPEPAGMALWTEPAVDTGRMNVAVFDGGVIFRLCGIITIREGAETSDTESILDCFEDAALSTLNGFVGWAPPLRYSRETRIERGKLMPLSDGFRQWFDLSGKFELTLF